MTRTAAALVIGTEILTGKTQETNVHLLAGELFRLGIRLERVVICADDIETIAREVNELRGTYDLLFTSGGVGPTHDDLTLQAIAHALDRKICASPELHQRILEFVGEERWNDGHERMTLVPEGSRLIASEEVPWPTVVVENVFVLPGLPRVFELKMQILRFELSGDEPFHSKALYTRARESELAAPLAEFAQQHDTISVGSYPVWGNKDYTVKLTVDGRDEAEVDRALAALRKAIPSEVIVES